MRSQQGRKNAADEEKSAFIVPKKFSQMRRDPKKDEENILKQSRNPSSANPYFARMSVRVIAWGIHSKHRRPMAHQATPIWWLASHQFLCALFFSNEVEVLDRYVQGPFNTAGCGCPGFFRRELILPYSRQGQKQPRRQVSKGVQQSTKLFFRGRSRPVGTGDVPSICSGSASIGCSGC